MPAAEDMLRMGLQRLAGQAPASQIPAPSIIAWHRRARRRTQQAAAATTVLVCSALAAVLTLTLDGQPAAHPRTTSPAARSTPLPPRSGIRLTAPVWINRATRFTPVAPTVTPALSPLTALSRYRRGNRPASLPPGTVVYLGQLTVYHSSIGVRNTLAYGFTGPGTQQCRIPPAEGVASPTDSAGPDRCRLWSFVNANTGAGLIATSQTFQR